MRIITMSILGVVLTGCSISTMDKAKQDQVCYDKGGVYKYSSGILNVECRDGSFQEWGDIKLLPEFYPEPEEEVYL